MPRRNILKDFNRIIRRVDESINWRLARRAVHLFLSVSVVYYLIPQSLWLVDLPKWVLLPLAVIIVVSVELGRLSTGQVFRGMRDHEHKAIGSYVYAVIGIATVLALSPPEIGIPVILGMAFVDPLAGELRLHNRKKKTVVVAAMAAYAVIVIAASLAMGTAVRMLIPLAVVLTPIAILSEEINIRNLDDDFSMVFFPAVAGMLVLSAFG